MSFTKTYFLCPTTDFIFPPPTGPLCLGSIIRSTSEPQNPLNKASAVAVPNAFPPIVETDWKKTVSTETGVGLGVYAQFLQLATGGLEVEHSNKQMSTFAFDTMTTLSFEPTQEYIEEAVRAPAVQAWLQKPRQRFALVNALYLVTGMKLVKGAKIKYATSQSTAVKENVGIGVTALGATVGANGHWKRANEDAAESNREDEFVFAFRVKKLKFGRRVNPKDYSKGAYMNIGGQEDKGRCVSVEDVDGAGIKNAKAVPDETENEILYCVPA